MEPSEVLEIIEKINGLDVDDDIKAVLVALFEMGIKAAGENGDVPFLKELRERCGDSNVNMLISLANNVYKYRFSNVILYHEDNQESLSELIFDRPIEYGYGEDHG